MMAPEESSQTDPFEQSLSRLEWLMIAVAAIFILFNTFTRAIIDNDRSRLASVQSLVEEGTWIIDNSRFHQEPGSNYQIIDKIQIGDHFYSSKPPVLPLLMAGEYWVLHRLGLDFDKEGPRRFLIWFLTFSFTGLPFLCIGLIFKRASRWFIQDPVVRLAGLFIILFCHELLGFSLTINNHVPAAFLLFATMVAGIGLVHEKISPRPIWFILSGLMAGLLPTFELPACFFCVAFWLYLLRSYPLQTLVWFTIGATPPLALHFGLTYLISGSVIPFYMSPELYQYEGGSYWNLPRAMDAAGEYESKITYFFHLSVGRKGLFSLYPVLLLSLAHFFWIIRDARFRLKTLLFLFYVFLFPIAGYLIFLSADSPFSSFQTQFSALVFLAFGSILLWYLGGGASFQNLSLFQLIAVLSTVTLPVFGWVAWAEQRDPNTSFLINLFYYLIFALFPILVCAAMAKSGKQGIEEGKPELAFETVGMTLLTFFWMLFYTVRTDNYGGSATGYRWFMFFTPAFQFFGLFSLSRMKSRWLWALVCLLVGIAFYSGWQATVKPWSMNWDWPVRFLGKWVTR